MDLSVQKGDVLGIIGPNGVGKSTLFKTIVGFEEPDSGEVKIGETVKVSYTGILPDLFKEGQGAVARGRLGADGVFYAEEVLAKHDESYMPPEVQDAVDKAQKMGVAQQGADAAPSSVKY